MINEKVLADKLKYLITMNAKSGVFNIIDINISFEFNDQLHEQLVNYDVDIEFDYNGVIDFDLENFAIDIQKMSDKLEKIVMEYVITQDGKIVNRVKSEGYTTGPLIFKADYVADEKHVFLLGYKFNYERD